MKKKEKILLTLTKFRFENMIFTMSVILLIIAGLMQPEPTLNRIITSTFIILGIVIGITNIVKKEYTSFLISTIALIIITAPIITIQVGNQIIGVSIFSYICQIIFKSQLIYNIMINITNYFIALITPAVIIVAIKGFFNTAKD